MDSKIINLTFTKTALMIIWIFGLTARHVEAADILSHWHKDLQFFFNYSLVSPREIGSDINAPGGELLVATLGDLPFFGVEAGISNDLLEFSGNLARGLRRIKVENEYGVEFPNHGESTFYYTFNLSFFPFRKGILKGKIRPYLETGIGATLVQVDLDNIDGKEIYNLLTWNLGCGVKYFVKIQYISISVLIILLLKAKSLSIYFISGVLKSDMGLIFKPALML